MISSSMTFFYACLATAFLLLAALASAGWRRDMRGGLYTGACWVTGIWALFMAWISHEEARYLLNMLPVIEWLKIVIWLVFIGSLFVASPKHYVRQLWKKRAARLILLLVLLTLISSIEPLFLFIPAEIVKLNQDWLILMLLIVVSGMISIENLYRRADTESRWRLKFLCLGIGGLFAFDFILYADMLLFRAINPILWMARAIIDTLLVPFLAVAAARNRAWSIDIQVSREVVFQSGIGLISGLYLVGLALGGYYIRYRGGAWGEMAQVVLLFLGSVFFVALLASRQLRSSIRVFVSKNFFSYQFDYREQWLKFTRLLSSTNIAQPIEASALQAIAGLVDSPRGQLWLRIGNRYEIVAARNMPMPEQTIPENSSLIECIQERGWVIDLEHPTIGNLNLIIPDWLQQQTGARLIVPLLWQNELIGFVLLGQPQGGLTTNWEVNDLLKVAGRQAASYLAQARAARDLLVARQFESFNKMSAFIVHDLKNLVSQLDLVLANAPRLIDRPDFQKDMLDTVANSVQRMKHLLSQLQDQRMPSEHAVVLDLNELCNRAVQHFKNAPITPEFNAATAKLETVANPERLERVIRHLLGNAIDAVIAADFETKRIVLSSEAVEANRLMIMLTDNGIGMTSEFIRERLFRPFESTKNTGTGLGMYESREYIHSLGGEIEVMSQINQGTTIKIYLPRLNRPL